jgi:hypothetical protein
MYKTQKQKTVLVVVVVSPIVSFDLANDSFCSPISNWWYNQFTFSTL